MYKIRQIFSGFFSVIIGLVVLLLIFAGGCQSNEAPKKVEKENKIASTTEEVIQIDNLKPIHKAVLSTNVFEGIIDKVDPTWIDRTDINDQKFITDLTVKVYKSYKGENLAGKVVVVRNKQGINSTKNNELFNVKVDSKMLFYVIKDKEQYASTTGIFSDYFVLEFINIKPEGKASYDQHLTSVEEAAKMNRQQKMQQIGTLPINKSKQNELVTSG